MILPEVGDIVSTSEDISHNGRACDDTYRIVEIVNTFCFAVCVSIGRQVRGRIFFKNPKKLHKFSLDQLYFVTDESYIPEIQHIVSNYNNILQNKIVIQLQYGNLPI